MIPYTIERRADTGLTNPELGIWLFLASEVMLFGALFSAYALLRTAAISWPHGHALLSLPIGGTNTVILLAATAFAWRARAKRDVWLLVPTTSLAIVFLTLKSVEYHSELSRGLVPATNTFLATYFTLTGLHALHVLAGLVANLWAVTGLPRVGAARTIGRVQALALYWAFVDVVWIVIFVLCYLT